MANDSNYHECPADLCHERVHFTKIACTRHWAKVNPTLQGEIYREWRRGISLRYIDLRECAIAEMNKYNA